jgi:acyl carrier protein
MSTAMALCRSACAVLERTRLRDYSPPEFASYFFFPWDTEIRIILGALTHLRGFVLITLKGKFLTLTGQTIQDRVLKVIAASKRVPLESLDPESSFESLGIDSLDRLNILFDLESEFNVEIKDEEAQHIENIHEMIEGISRLVHARADSSSIE